MAHRSTMLGLTLILLITACTGESATTSPSPSTTTTVSPSSTSPPDLPGIISVETSADEVPNYALLELTVDLEAQYDNPFDAREVRLEGVFAGPDGSTWNVPGFWDAKNAWRMRFTPSQVGDWTYRVWIEDSRGDSQAGDGSFTVAPSDNKGWLRVGSDVDPSYSPHYLAFSDGTPWYGRGHADLDMALGGADRSGDGLRLFNSMAGYGENFVMWWPSWGNNFIQATYDDYSSAQLEIIDYVLREAEAKDVTVAFTIWTHQYLRTNAHPWGNDRWAVNGFSKLTDIAGFFVDPESLAWQQNYYRYIIARYAHSPAVAMWQTITEINGTESYDETDTWHEGIDSYFKENDPYRHPTSATMSGWVDWPRGHSVMGLPQVHLYHELGNPVEFAAQVVDWTRLMWEREEKPNWVGEYGLEGQQHYPELMHSANWAALVAGAAMTPIEWNDRSGFGTFDDEMAADMARFSTFVEEVPLVVYAPEPVEVGVSDQEVRGWALLGESGGVAWIQDFALETATMDDIRADRTVRSEVVLTLDPVTAGVWTVTPFDTWQGMWLDPITVDCPGGICEIPVPDFTQDLAFKLERL